MMATPVACAVDASVGIKLVITETLSRQAHALVAHLAKDPAARFWVPELFYLECANILWKHVHRSGYPLAYAQLVHLFTSQSPHPLRRAFPPAFPGAQSPRRAGCTAA